MDSEKTKEVFVIFAHALVGWALCGAIMGVGPTFLSMDTTLIIHAVAAPIIFGALSWNYFNRYGYTSPLQTALSFTAFVIFMDFFLVSWIIMGSFEMFSSVIGTWLPFALIFSATYLTGLYVKGRDQAVPAAS